MPVCLSARSPLGVATRWRALCLPSGILFQKLPSRTVCSKTFLKSQHPWTKPLALGVSPSDENSLLLWSQKFRHHHHWTCLEGAKFHSLITEYIITNQCRRTDSASSYSADQQVPCIYGTRKYTASTQDCTAEHYPYKVNTVHFFTKSFPENNCKITLPYTITILVQPLLTGITISEMWFRVA